MAEVASGFVTLIPSFKGGGRAIQKELDGAAGPAGVSAGKKAGRGFSGGLIGGIGKAGLALGAAFAAPAVIGGLNSLADKASDLNETVNKSQVIFGKQAGAIDKWASSAATNLGLSKSAALAAAAGFGDMFSQIGFSGKAAAAMSKDVVQVSADLGSFSNLDTADVSDRIAAAFRGEYDSLQAVIPNINAARVESEAMAMTGKKTAKELTAQEKAAAVLAIVHKDGARAMGDFAKTSDGAANKAKIQAARFEDLKTKAGGVLLPIKSLALDGFGALITGAEKLGPFITKVVDGFKSLFSSGGQGTSALAPLVAFFNGPVKAAFAGIVQSVQRFATVALPIVQQFVAGMRARIEPMLPTIRTIFTTIGTIITGAMGLVQAVISRVTAIIGGIWSRWGTNIMDFVAKVFGAVLTIIGGALKVIGGIIKLFTAIFKGDWSGAWAAIKQIVSGAWQVIKGIVSGALTIIGGVIRGAATLLKGAMSAVWGKITEAVGAGITAVKRKAGEVVSAVSGALGNLGGTLYAKGSALVQGLIDGIASKIQAVKDKVGQVAQAIKDFFPGSPVKTGPLTSWNNGGAGKRLGTMLADGLSASQRTVAAASRGMAGSVAVPGATLGASGVVGGGLSQSDITRLAAAMSQVQLRATVSAGSFDSAMAVGL